MATPQTGIFALGDAAHIYLEFAMTAGTVAERLVRAAKPRSGKRCPSMRKSG
jgi:hypothetical protein